MTSTPEAVEEEIMANPARGGATDFNANIIEGFRANRGRVGGPLTGTPMSLIHHIGARSSCSPARPALIPPGVR
jgi:hypothetical protein